MFRRMLPLVIAFTLTNIAQVACGQGRVKQEDDHEWNLADGSRESGELVSVDVTIRLPNGDTKTIPFTGISRADQKFVTHWLLTDKDAKPITVAGGGVKPAAKPAAHNPRKQEFTISGETKLTENEILGCIEEWRKEKPSLLSTLRTVLNAKASTTGASPDDIQAAKDTYQTAAKESVLIVHRDRWSDDENVVFKYDIAGYPSADGGVIDVLKIVDNHTAFVSMNGIKAFIEGVDTKQIPIGKWRSQYLLKRAGSRKVPATIGEDELHVYQAISLDGFPKDIMLW